MLRQQPEGGLDERGGHGDTGHCPKKATQIHRLLSQYPQEIHHRQWPGEQDGSEPGGCPEISRVERVPDPGQGLEGAVSPEHVRCGGPGNHGGIKGILEIIEIPVTSDNSDVCIF